MLAFSVSNASMLCGSLVLAFALGSVSANASQCEAKSSVPADYKVIASGSATAGSDGESNAKGNQGVYVTLKNENVLGVMYSLKIAQDVTPENVICTYDAILPPQTSATFYGALFAEPPIGWKISVSISSDAGVITYKVSSLPIKSAHK